MRPSLSESRMASSLEYSALCLFTAAALASEAAFFSISLRFSASFFSSMVFSCSTCLAAFSTALFSAAMAWSTFLSAACLASSALPSCALNLSICCFLDSISSATFFSSMVFSCVICARLL